MKIDELRAFCAVVDTGSFSRAADQLYMTQPTVSKYVARLESELGCQLLCREARGVELTELGNKAYLRSKRMVEEWEKLQGEVQNARLGEQPRLRIGYTFDKMIPFVTKALSNEHFPHRELDLTLRFGEGETLTYLLQSGQLDCVVMHLASFQPTPGLEARTVCFCQLQLVVPVGHPLWGQKSVTLAQASQETDVRPKREARFFEIQDRFFTEMGLTPMNHVYAQDATDTQTLANYYHYVRLSPDIYPADSGFYFIPIVDHPMNWPLVLVTRKETRSNIVEDFFEAMRRTMGDKQ